MPYPNTVCVSLLSINGNSCGTLANDLNYVVDSDPPEYVMETSEYFAEAYMYREDLGGGSYTWRLYIDYRGGGSCQGAYWFNRTQAADDPVGSYCRTSGGQLACNLGQASVADADSKQRKDQTAAY